ncbi:MAG: peptide chain release factor N(5)-glutamine methyltransferase [Chitinophagaceae bacterium]
MTIHEASLQLRFQLFHIYDEREAGNIADLVLEKLTGWQKIDRVMNKNVPLSQRQEEQLQQYTDALAKHQPVQYVLQEAWFYNMKLYVDENVLIPRPETEELADWIIKDLREKKIATPKIIDIGTGSGCIPLALKKNLINADVHACDISTGALAVAQKNASSLHLSIQWHQLDILNAEARNALPAFDIIVSNPPYIPQSDKASMAANVLEHEPHLALFVEDSNPLLFYTTIADFAKQHLTPTGSIYFEIHEAMGSAVTKMLQEKGFANVELRKDLQGRDRMIACSR